MKIRPAFDHVHRDELGVDEIVIHVVQTAGATAGTVLWALCLMWV